MKSRFLLASALASACLSFSPASQATVVYSEGFDGGFGSSNWSRGDAYWSDCGFQGNCVLSSGGQSGAYFNLGTRTGPEPDHTFFQSASFAVTANVDYTLSFYIRDDYAGFAPYNVPVLAMINGSAIAPVQRASVGGWNLISLNWNSGSATSAVLELENEYQLSGYYQSAGSHDWGFGNDFAIDTISVACTDPCTAPANVPEPASLALMGLGLAGLGFRRRQRKTA